MPTTASQTANYQIRKREDGRFEVVQFVPGQIDPVLRAIAHTRQGAKDYVAIETEKQQQHAS